jgi:hypothetical protein
MKYALNESSQMILAELIAPKEAICPYCKGIVILRVRQRSKKPGDATYFWRHKDHNNTHCPARFRLPGTIPASQDRLKLS